MKRLDKFFVYSIYLYAVAIMVFTLMLYWTSVQFRKGMTEMRDMNQKPIRMEVIYQEEK